MNTGGSNIVIDDGRHLNKHSYGSCKVFCCQRKRDNYVVEDMQTSDSQHWGGELPATQWQFKRLTDGLTVLGIS